MLAGFQFRDRHAAIARTGLPLPAPIAAGYEMGGIQSLLISFNGRMLGCGPGDAEFDSPSQDQMPV
jgi:hypothetical protein